MDRQGLTAYREAMLDMGLQVAEDYETKPAEKIPAQSKSLMLLSLIRTVASYPGLRVTVPRIETAPPCE